MINVPRNELAELIRIAYVGDKEFRIFRELDLLFLEPSLNGKLGTHDDGCALFGAADGVFGRAAHSASDTNTRCKMMTSRGAKAMLFLSIQDPTSEFRRREGRDFIGVHSRLRNVRRKLTRSWRFHLTLRSEFPYARCQNCGQLNSHMKISHACSRLRLCRVYPCKAHRCELFINDISFR
jgi:hypothetical protein